jgi:nicotinamidase-related amidase
MNPVKVTASYYQQFDADYAREVPAEGYGGWGKSDIEVAPDHTALVVMHAWEAGTMEQWPGWRRAVEYHPRGLKILAEVFPPLLSAVRATPLKVFHVVGWKRDYYAHLPAFQQTVALAGPSPRYEPVAKDPVYERLEKFRGEHVFVGTRNRPDVEEGSKLLDFAPQARPAAGEGIAEDGHQLAALCRAHGINHLVYIGFAINWCLLMSPGGMLDMGRYGVLCSTIREAVTAVENKETAREEREKLQALWRVALQFGFVFGLQDFTAMVKSLPLRQFVSSG